MVKPLGAGLAASVRFATARTGSSTALFETMPDVLQGADLLDGRDALSLQWTQDHM